VDGTVSGQRPDRDSRRVIGIRVGAWSMAAVGVLSFVMALVVQMSPVPTMPPPLPFQAWLTNLKGEAMRRGFDRRLVTRALSGLQPSPRVIQADRAQVGASPALDVYLSQRLTSDRIARGRDQMGEHRSLLGRVERVFGVQRQFVVAIWGIESGYGVYAGDVPVVQALATLAWDPRRAPYFREELFQALGIAQREHIDIESMMGSWAGAMGQPQFMPSSYAKYAVDFDGDGRRDIWRSIPDTLASIANYLRTFGWHRDETWGREVRVTIEARRRIMSSVTARKQGCGAIRALTTRRQLGEWAADGVRTANGLPLPPAGVGASLVITADARTFLVTSNYEAILAYNCSHYYALSVAMLADAVR
jgi:membrane-bound lytic murein transglycosylase B